MSFVLMCLFLLLAIILRVYLQYRKTGDYGIRLSSWRAPLIETLPGTVFILTFFFAFIFVSLEALNVIYINEFPLHISLLGFIIGLLGITLISISQFQMGNAWRIGVSQEETTELITQGIYSKSRNPIYFGIFLFWIGISLTSPHFIIWLCALICWICIEIIVRKIEEPYLHRTHGNDFKNYAAITNRYLPL